MSEPTPLGQNGRRETWMVVRRDGKIPGGWRVVQFDLTEEEATARAAEYKRPHRAMKTDDLYASRLGVS